MGDLGLRVVRELALDVNDEESTARHGEDSSRLADFRSTRDDSFSEQNWIWVLGFKLTLQPAGRARAEGLVSQRALFPET